MRESNESLLLKRIAELERLVGRLTLPEIGAQPVFLQVPLTSTAWDGDAFSTTAKTKIDLSAVFGVPDGIKSVDVFVMIRDSGSSSTDPWIILSPNDTTYSGKQFGCGGLANDTYNRTSFTVTCDANGDIYYQISASGSGTLDVYLQIWGYWK